jgi:hypothetical protein
MTDDYATVEEHERDCERAGCRHPAVYEFGEYGPVLGYCDLCRSVERERLADGVAATAEGRAGLRTIPIFDPEFGGAPRPWSPCRECGTTHAWRDLDGFCAWCYEALVITSATDTAEGGVR